MEALGDVDGDVVDVVLEGAAMEFGLQLVHLSAVFRGYLVGLKTDEALCLKVDETIRARAKVEVEFKGTVEGVKEDDFMSVVA